MVNLRPGDVYWLGPTYYFHNYNHISMLFTVFMFSPIRMHLHYLFIVMNVSTNYKLNKRYITYEKKVMTKSVNTLFLIQIRVNSTPVRPEAPPPSRPPPPSYLYLRPSSIVFKTDWASCKIAVRSLIRCTFVPIKIHCLGSGLVTSQRSTPSVHTF